ncbi:hypothetical protein [Nitrosovibrio sp. Nv4]|uniref:hypothetical protein n=1 Tax=Nitrosovibrio sp. Nv4 TaxID=1945880 RepID=UPI000BD9AA0F|nr:hypothetical protein [Nitrosovibrio sp. Nv4]SOD41350.1 hypothetical protein SAMN06298226_1645 [Nitrosovibrio sp. Nv4]
MRTPHVHAVVIKAWADGAQIQIKERGKWVDYRIDSAPHWVPAMEYRVKPETLRYRVALHKQIHFGGFFTGVVSNDDGAVVVEGCATFVRWLTNWVEVEV